MFRQTDDVAPEIGTIPPEKKIEWLACAESPGYFIDNYVFIYDAEAKDWIPFKLWVAQYTTLSTLAEDRLICILKTRQVGLTWLVLAYILHQMIFHPQVTGLLFSRRDTEATHLLERLGGMFDRLPPWMKSPKERSNEHLFSLANGSVARAFPTTAGDSYTATHVLVDEADLVPDLNRLMRAVKPTIDAGGKLVLLSRANKDTPMSEFKRVYRGGRDGRTEWKSVFVPWNAHPGRDEEWYNRQKNDILERTGSVDDLYEQYPSTDTEALAARVLDKRFPVKWVERCFSACVPIDIEQIDHEASTIPGIVFYAYPEKGAEYVIGGDPAEGNPSSDDSAATVLESITGEEVASLRGKFQPAVFAGYLGLLSDYYNKAGILPERNNHGHAVILWLKDNKLPVINGVDKRPGWLSSSKGKTMMYDAGAMAFKTGNVVLHSVATMEQILSIEGSTLRAPEGLMDDLSDSFVIAAVARTMGKKWRKINFKHM